jgi:putative ABC transport system permease protein
LILLKVALRPLWNEKAFSVFFVSNFTLALFALFTVLTLRTSVSRSIEEKSKSLAGADVLVSVRRPFTEEELADVSAATSEEKILRLVDSLSMVGTDRSSRLAQLRAVPKGYPFYGTIKIEGTQKLGAFEIWMDPQLGEELEVEPGQSISIGGRPFKLVGWITEDTTQSFANLSIAPRILVRRQDLEKTVIVSRGSTAYHRVLIQTDRESEVVDRLKELLTDPAIRIRGHRESSREQTRLIGYLSDYLALVGLLALFLVSIGLTFQLRRFFADRMNDHAVVLALGGRHRQLSQIWALQITALALVSAFLALGTVALLLPWISPLVQELSPVQSSIQLRDLPYIVAVPAAWAGSLVLALPMAFSMRRISTKSLLQEDASSSLILSPMSFAPAAVFFVLLVFWAAPSFPVSGGFLGGLAVAILLLFLLFRFLIQALPGQMRGSLGLATRSIQGRAGVSLLLMMTLGLTFVLSGVLPSLESSLRAELEPKADAPPPQFFMFDVQEDQIDALATYLSSVGEVQSRSAMIRARLMTVNGEEFDRVDDREEGDFRTREQEQEEAFRNRGFNLSYRAEISGSEEVTEGQWFTEVEEENLDEVASLSVEKEFANRLGWKLGDRLLFEIQGVPVGGIIRSFRRVRWSSFQPNFFILFPPGFIDEAPKTFIVTFRSEGETKIRPQLLKQFPNVSVIDVQRALTSLERLTAQVLFAIRLMAIWTLIASLFTFAAILRFEVFERRTELNLLRVLGSSRASIRRLFLIETVLTGGVPILIGSGLSLLMAWAIARFALQLPLVPNFGASGLVTIVGLIFLFALVSWLTRQVLMSSPKKLLGESD